MNASAEGTILEEFSLKPYLSLGAGIQPMTTENKNYYGNIKLFPLQYGPAEIGMSFFGLGYSIFDGDTSFSFSPLGLRANNLVVSMDIHRNNAQSVGVSLSYYLPISF